MSGEEGDWNQPATPCAQGKLGRPLKVLILEWLAASENGWAQFWAHPCGEASLLAANCGKRRAHVVIVWTARRCRNATTTIEFDSDMARRSLHACRRGIFTTFPSPLGATGIFTC